VLDDEGVPRFELLQRFQRDRKGELRYFVFDLLYLNGEDLTGFPWYAGERFLKGLLPKEGPIRFSDAMEEHGIEFSEPY
jgi:bifunctional non-homologous end joining protein LigD